MLLQKLFAKELDSYLHMNLFGSFEHYRTEYSVALISKSQGFFWLHRAAASCGKDKHVALG